MKRSLQEFPFFVALFVLFFSVTPASARFRSDAAPRTTHPSAPALSLSAPADVTVTTDPWLATASNVQIGSPVITASASDYTVSNDAPSWYPIGTTLVTWRAADSKGNTATAIQKVTVVDNEKPYVYRQYEISVVNDAGKCGAAVTLFTPDYYDNSGSVTFTNDAPAFFPVGSTLVTWTATDAYGNSDTSTQLITVIDNELPSISIADVHGVTAAGKCGGVVSLGRPSVSDNCGVASVENDAPAFFPTGTTIVHWTVTDNAGFTNVAEQKVTVTDTESPVITAPAALTLSNTTGKCGYAGAIAPPVVSDNCGVASIPNNAPAVLPTGTTIITWTAVDNSGNRSSVNQSVTVKDTEAPVFINAPANATVACDAVPAAVTPALNDNCTASPTVTFTQSSTQSANTSVAARYNYTITRTWVARDAAGNSSTARQVITVQDVSAPVITVPATIAKPNDLNTCGAKVTFAATATDGCGSPVTLSYSRASGSVFASGTTEVTVTAKDVSGNTATKTFLVIVNDTQKPTIKAPAPVTTSTGGTSVSGSSVSLGNPTTSDNCGVQSVTNNAPASYPVGTTTVTWTVTDPAGNTATATQTVTVTSTKKRSNENETAIAAQSTTDKALAAAGTLKITVAPNPSTSHFTLYIQSAGTQPVNLRVFDVQGRVVEARNKLGANATIQVGHTYTPGSYFAEIIQGSERKTVQLLKVK